MNFAHKAKDNTGIVHIKLQLYADLFLNPIPEPCLIILPLFFHALEEFQNVREITNL